MNVYCLLPRKLVNPYGKRFIRKREWFDAAIDGLANAGHRPHIVSEIKSRHDSVLTYGSGDVSKHTDKFWLHVDSGYIKPDSYFRLVHGSVHATTLKNVGCNGSRWDGLGIELKPWNRNGNSIVVCCVSRLNCKLNGVNIARDLAEIKSVAKNYPNLEMVIRKKIQHKIAKRPLVSDLTNAYVTITWSSASAVESLINGVPIITMCKYVTNCMSGTLVSLAKPNYPDRERFLWDVANNQWSIGEFKSGLPFNNL